MDFLHGFQDESSMFAESKGGSGNDFDLSKLQKLLKVKQKLKKLLKVRRNH